MDKRGKVIKGLECCSVKRCCLGCPWEGKDCNDRLHLAALELLKGQETELCDRCGRRRLISNRVEKEGGAG